MKVSTSFGTVKVVMLKGEKGDKFQFEDYTPEELESLRGEQGEPFTYDDFTEEQLEYLRSEVASAYYRKVEATYYTIGDNTETITIPIEGYKDSDMLFIDVEGLALTEGVDYTIDGNTIVLTEPITHHYTAVNFRALCAFAITAEDYELLKAEEAHRAYKTVADMLADENLTNGMIVRTLGFHSAGDGGAALYLIGSTGTANGMDVLACENGLYASLVITGAYVTPEMFGAYGDGIHDDTNSWNKCTSIGINVICPGGKRYLTGQINVSSNIEIDCGYSSFISIDSKLFYIYGSVTKTEQASDYENRAVNYVIPDATYTGKCFLKGDNNWEPSRSYYVGGFIADVLNGHIQNSYPIPVENVEVDYLDCVTVTIKNILDIETHVEDTSTRVIHVLYGSNCLISNVNMKNVKGYGGIWIEKSIYTNIENCNIVSSDTNGDRYPIAIIDSCFSSISHCHVKNDSWHAITTGGVYLVYSTNINDCLLESNNQLAYCDHDNALSTIITNTISMGIGVCGLSTIQNCTIKSINGNEYKNCQIRIALTSIEENAIYTIDNIVFDNSKLTTNAAYHGIWFTKSAQVSGGTYYLRTANVKNIDVIDKTINPPSIRFAILSGSKFIVKDIYLAYVDLYIALGFGDSEITNNYVDISNYNLYIDRLKYNSIGSNGYKFNNIFISNCPLVSLATNGAANVIADSMGGFVDAQKAKITGGIIVGAQISGYKNVIWNTVKATNGNIYSLELDNGQYVTKVLS